MTVVHRANALPDEQNPEAMERQHTMECVLANVAIQSNAYISSAYQLICHPLSHLFSIISVIFLLFMYHPSLPSITIFNLSTDHLPIYHLSIYYLSTYQPSIYLSVIHLPINRLSRYIYLCIIYLYLPIIYHLIYLYLPIIYLPVYNLPTYLPSVINNAVHFYLTKLYLSLDYSHQHIHIRDASPLLVSPHPFLCFPASFSLLFSASVSPVCPRGRIWS